MKICVWVLTPTRPYLSILVLSVEFQLPTSSKCPIHSTFNPQTPLFTRLSTYPALLKSTPHNATTPTTTHNNAAPACLHLLIRLQHPPQARLHRTTTRRHYKQGVSSIISLVNPYYYWI